VTEALDLGPSFDPEDNTGKANGHCSSSSSNSNNCCICALSCLLLWQCLSSSMSQTDGNTMYRSQQNRLTDMSLHYPLHPTPMVPAPKVDCRNRVSNPLLLTCDRPPCALAVPQTTATCTPSLTARLPSCPHWTITDTSTRTQSQVRDGLRHVGFQPCWCTAGSACLAPGCAVCGATSRSYLYPKP
jgi:hypothetical protein